MLRTFLLSITRSFSLYTQQLCMSYRFADILRAGSEWNVLILFASCQQTCTTYTIALCTVKNSGVLKARRWKESLQNVLFHTAEANLWEEHKTFVLNTRRAGTSCGYKRWCECNNNNNNNNNLWGFWAGVSECKSEMGGEFSTYGADKLWENLW